METVFNLLKSKIAMNTSEKFKIWLENIYISDKTGKPLTSGIQYVWIECVK